MCVSRWCRRLVLVFSVVSAPSAAYRPLSGQDATLFGYAGAESRFFFSEPAYPGQPAHANLSVVAQPGGTFVLGERVVASGLVRFRLDQSDPHRSYADLREAVVQFDHGPSTLRLGVNTVFWGTTESRHLVNIINQTDFLDGWDGDEKYGQLMGLLTHDLGRYGLLDVFLMSWFRPQRYPSGEGRPGVPVTIWYDRPIYESGQERWNVDWAARWSHALGQLDWALSYFRGTSRQPQLMSEESGSETVWVPRYDLIDQGGLELQWTRGAWLWKAESIVRIGQGPSFAAVTLGFEHTTFGAFGGDMDLGAILEYNYDARDNQTINIYDEDLFGALRLSLNDVQGTEVLVGALVDVQSGVTVGQLDASRRLTDRWALELTGRLFSAADDEDPVYWFRQDDYVQLLVEYHY